MSDPTGRRLTVVALSAIQLPIISEHLPRIIAAIDNALPGSFQVVDCGTFSRKKQADVRLAAPRPQPALPSPP